MPNKSISQLQEVLLPNGNEYAVVVKNGSTLKVALSKLKGLFSKGDIGLNNVDNTSDLDKPLSNDVRTALGIKSDLNHNHDTTHVVGLVAALDNKSNVSHTHGLDSLPEIDFKLTLKSNINHTHTFNEVADLQSTVDNKAQLVHGHSVGDVVGLQTFLDTHSHDVNDTLGLTTLLANKADARHLHYVNDISDFTNAISVKADLVHGHDISEINGLQSSLDSKALTSNVETSVNYLQAAVSTKVDNVDFTAAVSSLNDNINVKANTADVQIYINNLQSSIDTKANITDVENTITNLINGAPAALDTLKELADAAGAGGNFITDTAAKLVVINASIDAIPIINDISDVPGLSAALASTSQTVHSHEILDINNLTEELAVKAPIVHHHVAGDITDLQFTLDIKSNVGHLHNKDEVGLENADNTADVDKPISTATQSAIDGKTNIGHFHFVDDIDDFDEGVKVAFPSVAVGENGIDIRFDEDIGKVVIDYTPPPVSGIAIYKILGSTNFINPDLDQINSLVVELLPNELVEIDPYGQSISFIEAGYYRVKTSVRVTPPSTTVEEIENVGSVITTIRYGTEFNNINGCSVLCGTDTTDEESSGQNKRLALMDIYIGYENDDFLNWSDEFIVTAETEYSSFNLDHKVQHIGADFPGKDFWSFNFKIVLTIEKLPLAYQPMM